MEWTKSEIAADSRMFEGAMPCSLRAQQDPTRLGLSKNDRDESEKIGKVGSSPLARKSASLTTVADSSSALTQRRLLFMGACVFILYFTIHNPSEENHK